MMDVLITKSLTFAKVFRIGQRKKGIPLTLELCSVWQSLAECVSASPAGGFFLATRVSKRDCLKLKQNLFLSLIFMRKAFTAMAPTQTLLVKRLSERATVPTRGSSHAAGYDLYR